MNPHELRMLEVEKLHVSEQQDYDTRVVRGLTIDDLIPELVDQYLARWREDSDRLRDRTDTEILRRTGVIVDAGDPTLAGLYAMGDFPQGQFPALQVTAAVQLARHDARTERTRNLTHFTGPVPVLLDAVMQWLDENLATITYYQNRGHLAERPDLPLSALRELVANALVHRDLGPNQHRRGAARRP